MTARGSGSASTVTLPSRSEPAARTWVTTATSAAVAFGAGGAGSLVVEVRVPGRLDRGALLGYLAGATMHRDDRAPDRWRLEVRHPHMTDGDHDATVLARPTLDLVNFSDVDALGRTHLRGVISALLAWPLDTEVLDERSVHWCTYCEERGHGGHPVGPYMPPERDEHKALLGRVAPSCCPSGPSSTA